MLKFFKTRQAAQRRLNILEEDGRLRYLGRVRIGTQKKVHVWSNRNIGRPFVRHETDLMRVFYAYWPYAYGLTGRDADENTAPTWT